MSPRMSPEYRAEIDALIERSKRGGRGMNDDAHECPCGNCPPPHDCEGQRVAAQVATLTAALREIRDLPAGSDVQYASAVYGIACRALEASQETPS